MNLHTSDNVQDINREKLILLTYSYFVYDHNVRDIPETCKEFFDNACHGK